MPQATTLFALTTPWRQALFYILLYAMTGANLPFIPVWLKAQGLTGGQIGTILALPLLLRAVTGPLSGVWSDRFTLYRTPLLWLAILAAVFYALMALGNLYGPWRFIAYLVLFTCGYTCSTGISPLLDSMTLQLSRSHNYLYALPRSVGSAAFVVASVAMGYVLLVAPDDVILAWVVLACAVMAAAGRFILPAEPRQDVRHLSREENASGWLRLRQMMKAPGLMWLILAVAFLQASHSFYYAFSNILWKAQGLSTSTCAWLWGLGVAAEIVFLMWGERLRRRVGPWRMLLLAGVLAAVRWGIMIMAPPLWALILLQLLHIFSFAAVYMAGLDLVFRLAPKGYEGLAQTTNAAYSNGVMMGLGTLASGAAYQAWGAGGYALMAGLAVAGLLCAGWLYIQRERFAAAA